MSDFVVIAEKVEVKYAIRQKFEDKPSFQAGTAFEKCWTKLSKANSSVKVGLAERGDCGIDLPAYYSTVRTRNKF